MATKRRKEEKAKEGKMETKTMKNKGNNKKQVTKQQVTPTTIQVSRHRAIVEVESEKFWVPTELPAVLQVKSKKFKNTTVSYILNYVGTWNFSDWTCNTTQHLQQNKITLKLP